MQKTAKGAAAELVAAGYRADFSLESLREIDRFLDDHMPGGTPAPGGALSDPAGNLAGNAGFILYTLGAYAGEVLRKCLGGKWAGDPKNPKFELEASLKLPGGSVVWPTQRVYKRAKVGAEESVWAWGFGNYKLTKSKD